jgi:hypothetical protein
MDAHIEIHINIAGLQENRIRLLFDRLKLTDNVTDLSLHVASHRLKVDRHTGRTAHHDRPPGEKADARKPPEALRFLGG